MADVPEFIKYGKIKALGDKENEGILDGHVVIEEKIDGGNFRFMLKDGKIIFGSRTTYLGDEEANIGGQFERCVKYVKETINKQALVDLALSNGTLIIFGENCVRHTLDYNWDKLPPFLGFDIYSVPMGKYLPQDTKEKIFNALGLPMVPKIVDGVWGEAANEEHLKIPVSAYASTYPEAEGIVIKNYPKQLFAKIVSGKFKEKNVEVFGKPKKFAETDTERVVFTYCTNSRIEKKIFQLIEENHELNMAMMSKLPVLVSNDIWEENWREIVQMKIIVDLHEFKKMVAKRCLGVLKQMMINNSLNSAEQAITINNPEPKEMATEQEE